MQITYTKYAEETLLERTISKKIVEEVISNPDEIVDGKKGRKIAHKIIGSKLIRVVCNYKATFCKVEAEAALFLRALFY